MAVDSSAALLGGRYRVVRRLGVGGMATVFLCEDERLERPVAVKRLHSAGPEDVARRFEREAKLGASLNHPNLVSVYDTLPDEEGVLIVMEYVDGPTLADELGAGPLPTERAIGVIRDVADGLDHAHESGVVHRDVKPANILLGRRGKTAKLADLGIATAAESTQITRSGSVLGTPAYMAPEQFEGGEQTPAVDVYALAAIAFEALGGRRAREGRGALEIAHRVATEPPPDLRRAWPQAPGPAADVLRRGMALDPAERPARASELAAGIERAVAASRPQASAPPPPGPADATPSTRRLPPLIPRGRAAAGSRRVGPAVAARLRELPPWAPLAIVLAMLVVGVVALAAGGGGDGDGRRAADRQSETPKPGKERQADGQGTAQGARLNQQGFALMQQGRYEQAVPVLRRAVDAFGPGSRELEYAFALYNLGRSLRLSGRPGEAIPILEQRLQIPNQRETVERELAAARAAVSGTPAQSGEGRGKKHGAAKKKGEEEGED